MTNLKISAGRCQFCHSLIEDAAKLVAGDSAFICADCVDACGRLLHPSGELEEAQESEVEERYLVMRLFRHFAPLHPNSLVATSRA